MIKNILWDFDGVILDSMEVRDFGFQEIFKKYKATDVKTLLEYHRLNGGLSRYVKIRYFFESILNKDITDSEVLEYATQFSDIMRRELTNSKNLIEDSVNFIKKNHTKFNFHIVSGSDQEELRFLCNELGIGDYFLSIHGSPTPKNTLVKDLLLKCNYKLIESCLVGDSLNDYEAAQVNNISFFGYNNITLMDKGNYLHKLTNFIF